VVVKIAGADVHFVGDMVGGDAWFAAFVEELQAGLQDAVAGFHGCRTGSDGDMGNWEISDELSLLH
jgi:hypothetical protein